jgi:hypothetical protein
MLMTTLHCH